MIQMPNWIENLSQAVKVYGEISGNPLEKRGKSIVDYYERDDYDDWVIRDVSLLDIEYTDDTAVPALGNCDSFSWKPSFQL